MNIVITTVSEDDVATLVEQLTPYAYAWRPIGLQLGFTVSQLNGIATPPGQNAEAYLETMLNKWVVRSSTTTVPPRKRATLENLMAALRSNAVSLGTVADELTLHSEDDSESSDAGICHGFVIVPIDYPTHCSIQLS